ncbi:MAG: V-type ATP synthase subunit I [Synergistetes bacterium]|nr:V-type ATP synthase subunit I [Synergistota bacterium]
MAVNEMLKLRVISHKSVKEEIVDALLRLGVIEFVSLPSALGDKIQALGVIREEDGRALSEMESFLNDLRIAIEFLDNANEDRRGLFDSLLGRKIYIQSSEFEDRVKKLDYKRVVEEIRGVERKLTELRNKRAQLSSERKLLEDWKDLNIPLEFFEEGTLVTAGLLGSIKTEEFDKFLREVEEKLSLWELYTLPSSPQFKTFALVYLREEHENLQDIIKNYSFNAVVLPKRRGTVRRVLEELDREIKELDKERELLVSKVKEYVSFLDDLKIVYDYLLIAFTKQKASMDFLSTSKVFVFEGWVRKKDRAKVESLFKRYSAVVAYSFEEPSIDEEVPVVIENHPLIRPFEVLTALYGLPQYGKDIDPTPYVAPFFFVFFGLCLSDAGYGVIMTFLIGWLLLKHGSRLSFSVKRFMMLLLLGGISTILFGALQGAWFDGLFAQVSWLKGLDIALNRIKIMDPLEDPMKLLVIALALGIVHVFLGLILKAYVNIRQGNIKDALFDQIGWLWFLTSLLFLGSVRAGWVSSSLAGLSKAMAIGGALFLILTQGRGERNILKKAIKGVISLYDVMGYLSDVLSYSRILALGLGTTVIAMIVNLLASMVLKVPVIGIVIALLILIVGHTLSLLVNALGAFVHSTRLQYVEFFSKFYSGGGKAFEPFTIKTRFTEIKE